MDYALIAGLIGMFLCLLAFFLDLFDFIDQDSFQFAIINAIGSGFLTFYAITLNSIPFLILNGIWVIASIYKILLLLKKKN